ncbi:alanine dehydrogenase [Natronogracilivirga saccharolytica]|uniref:alanine dehydrogenase n=1 Tax=Natronogracilivirga saccharolytica TaxID=2812953 RepID=A0A8J7UWT7_9BACT|nr:alanine dehydrogenase [Natronogracilivirga saccharolytica]MBP3192594.1 alanine dehydrogenase [Natronogracilivirga saccharolytica]
MEIMNPYQVAHQFGLKTLEKPEEQTGSRVSMKIGLPRERSNDERRLSVTPGGVSDLVSAGHEIFVEAGAGEDAGFPDHEFSEAGASVAWTTEELYKNSEIILKVAPPAKSEYELLQPDQTVISALHLGDTTDKYLKELIRKNVTAIGFEFIKSPDNSFPIVRMMHEITGSMSVQIAAHYLENNQQGQGIILGGISGVPPSTVVILGAGIISEYAARTALGYGAQVFVMDTDLARLRHLENSLDRRVITAMATHQFISSALKVADVVIGAAMVEGHRAPCWVTRQMVESMKDGSVIVDAVIDQGGCIETSKTTSHSNPVFVDSGVVHYCVPNIPSNAARTSTTALNNLLVPFLLDIGDAGGIREALWTNVSLRNGTYVYKNQLTKKSLAQLFDMPYRDIEMLIASRI